MSITNHGGPFVARRPGAAARWRKPGEGTRAAAVPVTGARPAGGGHALLVAACCAGILCMGLGFASILLARHEARVEAVRVAEVGAAMREPMNPGLAARLVSAAPGEAYARCYGQVERAGWPTAPTTAGASVARRVALAECLVRDGAVLR